MQSCRQPRPDVLVKDQIPKPCFKARRGNSSCHVRTGTKPKSPVFGAGKLGCAARFTPRLKTGLILLLILRPRKISAKSASKSATKLAAKSAVSKWGGSKALGNTPTLVRGQVLEQKQGRRFALPTGRICACVQGLRGWRVDGIAHGRAP